LHQRGFLLTGDTTYLQPYLASLPNIHVTIDQLQKLSHDNPTQHKQIDQLRRSADKRIALLQTGINLRKNQPFEATQAFINKGEGEQTMNAIRSLVSSIDNEEKQLLTSRQRDTTESFNTIYITTAVTVLLDLSLLILAYYLINR